MSPLFHRDRRPWAPRCTPIEYTIPWTHHTVSNTNSIGLAVFCTADAIFSLYHTMCLCYLSPQIAPSHGWIWTPTKSLFLWVTQVPTHQLYWQLDRVSCFPEFMIITNRCGYRLTDQLNCGKQLTLSSWCLNGGLGEPKKWTWTWPVRIGSLYCECNIFKKCKLWLSLFLFWFFRNSKDLVVSDVERRVLHHRYDVDEHRCELVCVARRKLRAVRRRGQTRRGRLWPGCLGCRWHWGCVLASCGRWRCLG